MKKAGLQNRRLSRRRGEGSEPDETQVFELPPVASNQGPKELPRIAYIFPMHSHQHPTQQKETVFYGSNIQGFMPTVVHPNEILDGALMFSYSAFTWFAQNHPVILELYRRHGKDLWFAGVVLTVAPATVVRKGTQCFAQCPARQGSLERRRHPLHENRRRRRRHRLDDDLHPRRGMGMKAALIIMERYPDTGITFVPENVNALVTPGLTRDPITLPAVDRVIGGETLHLDNANPDNTQPRPCRRCRRTKRLPSGWATWSAPSAKPARRG